jgi:hypothetical protein
MTTFTIKLRPRPGVEPILALRGAIKVLGRRFGLQVIDIREVEDASRPQPIAQSQISHRAGAPRA